MPFSRYQIRNEFSLADPELYKAADKDDPEALLEGVAMAGLVGVLRQLGDLAEFAAEIFHGLHEEVMVTAARGHGLLVRVQQVESDFPAIERAFLSQTGHSAFFSSSGISWHPNMQTEQNLITKGDLPRFVMDSYEECRGPPRLFLLDKFDVGGAGACLKRYTDPSFYKVEASTYEMMSVEAQRDKKIRKTKRKGQRGKNGDTPEVFQPSHVKLHQLLLEERVQNGASEPARRVKLKKREIKFPFDTESGKGYMEKLLNSPPEDKLVHEVPVGSSYLRLPTNISEEPEPETLEDRMVNPPLDLPETLEVRMVNSSLDGIEDKHKSEDGEQQENGVEDYQSVDVASETEDYMDALATMESEVETDAEIKAANSDPIIKQETFSDSNVEKLQSRFSDSQSASDDESSSIRNKVATFSYSDTTTTSPDNISPRGVNSPQPFATTEIPFRPRVSQNQVSDNCIEGSDIAVDQEAIFTEQTSKDSDFSEMSSNNCVDIGVPTRTEEMDIAPEEIISSTCVGIPQSEIDNEDNISNSSLVISNEEVQHFGPSVDKHDICDEDGFLESRSASEEAKVSYSSEDETKFKDEETVSVDSESKDANAVVCDPHDDKIGEDNLPSLDLETVSSETKDLIPDTSEITGLSTFEDNELVGREVESVELEKNEDNCVSTTEESCENGFDFNESVIVLTSNGTVENDSSKQLVIAPENEAIGSGEKKDLSEGSVISPENETIESGENKELSEEVISPSTDSVPSPYYDHLNIQDHDSIPTSCPATCNNVNENDVDDPSASSKILQDETLFVIEKTDQNGLQDQNAQFVDSAPDSPVSADAEESKSSNLIDNDRESKSQSQDDQSNKHEATLSIMSLPVSMEEKADRLETLKNQDYQNDKLDAASSLFNHSVSIEEKDDQLEALDSQNQDDQTDKLEEASSILNRSISLDEKADQLETLDSLNHVDCETHVDTHSDSYLVNHVENSEFQDHVEPTMVDLSQVNSHIDLSGFNMLPELAPINLEEMPPLPPLPPMQWRMGKLQNSSMISRPDAGQHDIHHFPPVFPQNESLPSLDQNENVTNDKSEHAYEGNAGKFAEEIVPKMPLDSVESQNVTISGTEIIRPSSTSTLPPADDERPNGIRPMKIQRPRTPLIDAVAAHDINKLKKVSERAMPLFPKEEERDTFLEQIRAQSFNLKPAVPTRPIIHGPSTNLRVAAILEKANAIRHAFAGSDDDEDDNDSWSDS